MKSGFVLGLSALVLACGAALAPSVAARPPADVAASASAVATATGARRPAPLLYSLVVSFNSLGEGVSYPITMTFRTQLNELEANWGPIERHIAHWGREGEYDVCMPLWEVPEPYRQNFIDDVRMSVEPSGRAHVSEQAPCGH